MSEAIRPLPAEPDGQNEVGGPGPIPVSPHLVGVLRALKREGAGQHYVTPKTARLAELSALERSGCLDLIAGVKGATEARLTVRGLQVLASAPGLLDQGGAR